MPFTLTTMLTLAKDQKLIESEWIGFKIAIGLDDAPEIQQREMRNAFFAGARGAFSWFERLGEDDVSPEETEAALKGIDAEFAAFLQAFAAEQLPTIGGLN